MADDEQVDDPNVGGRQPEPLPVVAGVRGGIPAGTTPPRRSGCGATGDDYGSKNWTARSISS
jgi:hypothetical protein